MAFTESQSAYMIGDGAGQTFRSQPLPVLLRVWRAVLMWLPAQGNARILFAIDGSTAGVLWKSADRGRSWTQVNIPGAAGRTFDDLATCGESILVADGVDNDGIYAFFSSDRGISWSAIPVLQTCTTCLRAVRGMACGSGGQWYISYNASPYVIYSSNPTGAWSNATGIAAGLTANLAATGNIAVTGLVSTCAQLATAPSGNAAFGSTSADQCGANFRVDWVGAKFASAQHTSAATCSFRTAVNGTGWTTATTPCSGGAGVFGFGGLAGHGDVILAGGFENVAGNQPRLFRSTDGGASFSNASSSLPTVSGALQINALIYYPP